MDFACFLAKVSFLHASVWSPICSFHPSLSFGFWEHLGDSGKQSSDHIFRNTFTELLFPQTLLGQCCSEVIFFFLQLTEPSLRRLEVGNSTSLLSGAEKLMHSTWRFLLLSNAHAANVQTSLSFVLCLRIKIHPQ